VSVPATIAYVVAASSPRRWFSIPAQADPRFTTQLRRLSIRDAVFTLVCAVLAALACAHAFE
jgi:hypothetical protein